MIVQGSVPCGGVYYGTQILFNLSFKLIKSHMFNMLLKLTNHEYLMAK